MPVNHTTSIKINTGVNTQGFFSYLEPDNLILFVHGFGGDSLGTWNNFSSAMLFDNHFKTSDFVFYGYDTFEDQAGGHAANLYNFINLLTQPLQNGILPKQQNLPERNYRRIILVAHSLGAVLVRQAQILAFNEGLPWVNTSVLALFAPAHNGANVIPLAMQALPGLSSLLGIFAKFKYPILNDLDPNENGILNAIRNDTQLIQGKQKGDFSIAKLVVHAQGDKIVKTYQYLRDAPTKVIPNSSHTRVCKPNDGYVEPLSYLKALI